MRESGPLEEDGMILNVMDQSLDILVPQLGVVKRVYLKFCPGVKSFEFTKGEKGKPAEIRLRWSVKLKSGDEPYEEEQILKIFHQVRLILTTESQTENKRANPFKVMGKLVPKLACGDEFYIPSTSADHKTDEKKNAVCSSKTVHGPISANIRAADDIRKKLFESEQEPEGPRTSEQGSEICHRGAAEIESHSSDDVIVESEEEASALPNGNDKSTKATEDNSDDVIVESETDPEEGWQPCKQGNKFYSLTLLVFKDSLKLVQQTNFLMVLLCTSFSSLRELLMLKKWTWVCFDSLKEYSVH